MGKTKTVVIAGLMLIAVASVIYAAPALAYMNGTSNQTRDLDRDRLRDGTRNDCDCPQAQNQACTQLRLRECTENQINASGADLKQQHRYQYRFRNQNVHP